MTVSKTIAPNLKQNKTKQTNKQTKHNKNTWKQKGLIKLTLPARAGWHDTSVYSGGSHGARQSKGQGEDAKGPIGFYRKQVKHSPRPGHPPPPQPAVDVASRDRDPSPPPGALLSLLPAR